MARPINADAEATRRRVLDSASALFADRGVDGTSIRDVAQGAGVSLGLVHHYFGSKDGLYQASIEAMYEELAPLREEFRQALLAGGDLGELVERVVRTGFRFACAHRAEIKLMMRTVVDTGEVEARWRGSQQLPFLTQVSALMEAQLGRPARELRLVAQSLVHLAIRYGLTAPRELALVADVNSNEVTTNGRPARRGDLARQVVEDHLVDVARRMLGIEENGCRNESATRARKEIAS